MKRPPCYKCGDRKQGCHSHCEKYAEWSAKGKAAHEKHLKAKAVDSFVIHNQIKTKEKYEK